MDTSFECDKQTLKCSDLTQFYSCRKSTWLWQIWSTVSWPSNSKQILQSNGTNSITKILGGKNEINKLLEFQTPFYSRSSNSEAIVVSLFKCVGRCLLRNSNHGLPPPLPSFFLCHSTGYTLKATVEQQAK